MNPEPDWVKHWIFEVKEPTIGDTDIMEVGWYSSDPDNNYRGPFSTREEAVASLLKNAPSSSQVSL